MRLSSNGLGNTKVEPPDISGVARVKRLSPKILKCLHTSILKSGNQTIASYPFRTRKREVPVNIGMLELHSHPTSPTFLARTVSYRPFTDRELSYP